MYNRPHFTEYIMARLVTLAVATSLLFAAVFMAFIPDPNIALNAIGFLILGFSVFIYAIYRGAILMQKELVTINKYLVNLDKVDKIDETHLFTQELEDINQNLIKVISSAKKRDEIKQRYNTKLKLKNRQRGDMISAIAHEFRNPIASIMGYAQTLEDDKDISQPLREKFLSKIYNNGIKIEALLSRLVLWNKFESGEATLHKSTFDVYTLAQEVKLVLGEQYKNREIHLEGSTLKIEADRTLVEIVLKNLIENALKYSKEEVLVHIGSDNISVTDKGVGIKSQDVEKVTKKFYRSGTHNWDNSMGLGLSIVKTILSMHHSKLEISSEEGVGSTFSFTL
ncbi:HAMP domain-containing sensor histidine kinase [Sulfurovum sp.]|uniref:sensor histidine kinase n=1 Tax=Sulfurovum sp. TaxID=1969726 RepID=UPI002867EA51|nr:HAMP domain-containing sensor histidine kinase [Sulfurovum sp.]